ncbi:MAG: DnaJ domain-containing protein [Firmicutes bacterium]|nr:DnaJ domain-containing protein [Bacillota bacterium]
MVNYYKLLGIDVTANYADIKAAYRKCAKQVHPDLHEGCESKRAHFVAIRKAYNVLTNPEKRVKYDSLLRAYILNLKTKRSRPIPYPNAESAPPPEQPAAPSAPPPAVEEEEEEILDEIERHKLEVELARVKAHEQIANYKRLADKKIKLANTQIKDCRKQSRKRLNDAVSKFSRRLNNYKDKIKNSILYAGMKQGYVQARQEMQQQIDDLTAAVRATERNEQRYLEMLEELTVIQQKNAELKQKIDLLSGLSDAEGLSAEAEKESLEQAFIIETQADEIAAERDSLKKQLLDSEEALTLERGSFQSKITQCDEEIDILCSEVSRLRDLIHAMQSSGAAKIDSAVFAAEKKQPSKKDTLYDLLELPLSAQADDIDAAFKRLQVRQNMFCIRYGPKGKHAKHFKKVERAFETLNNPAQKKAYDVSLGNKQV